ncbi:MAG: hypothetical protein HYS83_02695 [Candidatus Blackburnbacteria bacterium]|nr:hypothetical protein [Candidatus Blackburnbacteria bacterium]
MRKRLVASLFIVGVIGAVLFLKPLSTHTKVILLVSEEFPQIPIKPLGLIAKAPEHRTLELETKAGKAVADLFLPSRRSAPALVLAMGVRTQEKDKPVILHFARTMSRLGYVVLWPRLETLDKGTPSFEDPETFVDAFEYLESQETVDPRRISFIGFSVGSSVATVAAQDPRIAQNVRALVFFGGYYNAFDYVTSLATGTIVLDGREAPWDPAEGATGHLKEIFERRAAKAIGVFGVKSRNEAAAFLSALPQDELEFLHKLSPSENLEKLRARLFILHDRKDAYVSYTESQRLYNMLPEKENAALLFMNLFEHVQPQKGISLQTAGELLKLYGFLYKVFTSF